MKNRAAKIQFLTVFGNVFLLKKGYNHIDKRCLYESDCDFWRRIFIIRKIKIGKQKCNSSLHSEKHFLRRIFSILCLFLVNIFFTLNYLTIEVKEHHKEA